mmetsp:Transcript_6937/g.15059  ORF Transcript_6937/g.15059 Transcript_6937/m.15059 type:complete len:208 (-) Transcript_6937:1190-1813(-)
MLRHHRLTRILLQPNSHHAATPTGSTQTTPQDVERTRTPLLNIPLLRGKRDRWPGGVRGWCARRRNDDAIWRGHDVLLPFARGTRHRKWVCPSSPPPRPCPRLRQRPSRHHRGQRLPQLPHERSFPHWLLIYLHLQHRPGTPQEAQPTSPPSIREQSTPDSSPDKCSWRVDTWEAILPPTRSPKTRYGFFRRIRTPARTDRDRSWDG